YPFHRIRAVTDGSAVATGIILALIIPPQTPLWITALSAAFAIIAAKQIEGGLGKNIFNPALAGCAAVLVLSFFTGHAIALTDDFVSPFFAADSRALVIPYSSILQYPHASFGSFTLPGIIPLSGALFASILLLLKKAIRIETVLSAIAGAAGTALIASKMTHQSAFVSPEYYLLSGGFIFAVSVLAGDPVTSPVRRGGRILYGALFGALFCVISIFAKGGYPPLFSLFICNALVPVINRLFSRRFFGQ
ncbi:MAG: RnfABCDGE type electron transport complex subunit D, partial [Spirochaetota bacterium]